ncbi:glycosyltransferase family 4 protein [Rhodocytophaga rosea]|uniref:Glycosyltransferase family 4 protein n=1 Tax=Rhodocytophaga rosea TaxID=2704465 RepID=A0A6C0GDP0_9BACT|nr:glycosyltransferase family 4 protein [Rhodocytophaga rosea]QHT66081.1 glycosyltransferase family 4 protein [Rhodocytophaga rosea]
MSKPSLLYISINDGSDTRINKEIKILSAAFDIYYIGIGKSTEKAFVKVYCKSFKTVTGHHKSIVSLLRFYLLFLQSFFSRPYASFHVINEQLLLIFSPFLYWQKKKVVLDIFDSIFLRMNRKLNFLRNLVYSLPSAILVTDDNRKTLMPDAFQYKITVVENYPYRYTGTINKISTTDSVLIFYNGSMSKTRGTELLLRMLEIEKNMRVKMAGWVYDEATRELSQHPQVEFMGVITQQQSMQVASQCDYILSLYEPVNENNINASPNKIYDAIQAQTPVIINAEVKIASFVQEQKIGYVMDSFYETNYPRIIADLKVLKHTFMFNPDLQYTFTWEAIENKLLLAHKQ